MIGRELYNFTELFEWLYSMRENQLMVTASYLLWDYHSQNGKIIDKILKNNLSLSYLLIFLGTHI